jgi:hypothetical protein
MLTSAYPKTPIPGNVDRLSWLTGIWMSDHGEEHWSTSADGAMMGMFRWLDNGRVRFYEFFTLEQERETLVLRIKHFNPGLVGWEEKADAATFDLVSLADDEAVFFRRGGDKTTWMTYRKTGNDTIEAFFVREGEPPTDENAFKYTRIA